MSKELQKDFSDRVWDAQSKYIYYIMALSVSAIGFSIYQTMEAELSMIQIPLGIAVIFWGSSIFSAQMCIKVGISVSKGMFYWFDKVAPSSFNVEDKEKFKSSLENEADSGGRYFNMAERFFYFGIVLFVTWRVIEMANKSAVTDIVTPMGV